MARDRSIGQVLSHSERIFRDNIQRVEEDLFLAYDTRYRTAAAAATSETINAATFQLANLKTGTARDSATAWPKTYAGTYRAGR